MIYTSESHTYAAVNKSQGHHALEKVRTYMHTNICNQSKGETSGLQPDVLNYLFRLIYAGFTCSNWRILAYIYIYILLKTDSA